MREKLNSEMDMDEQRDNAEFDGTGARPRMG